MFLLMPGSLLGVIVHECLHAVLNIVDGDYIIDLRADKPSRFRWGGGMTRFMPKGRSFKALQSSMGYLGSSAFCSLLVFSGFDILASKIMAFTLIPFGIMTLLWANRQNGTTPYWAVAAVAISEVWTVRRDSQDCSEADPSSLTRSHHTVLVDRPRSRLTLLDLVAWHIGRAVRPPAQLDDPCCYRRSSLRCARLRWYRWRESQGEHGDMHRSDAVKASSSDALRPILGMGSHLVVLRGPLPCGCRLLRDPTRERCPAFDGNAVLTVPEERCVQFKDTRAEQIRRASVFLPT